ncbi:MAG: NAD-dependent epimerase/dehydratase family protein [Burkholderiaceae bacterium]|nr:NAD-dependent epimerase/dehydratase family protein [Burkholderiaceae bacterium]
MASPSELADGTVLLTGARGFTGAYVKAELERAGCRVVGAVVADPAAGEVKLDLTDAANCRAVVEAVRPDYVVHLAAISFVQHADAAEFYRVNTVGTANLLQALVDAGLQPRRVLLASSANVYGNAGGVIAETQAPQPVNHYAASKLAMEHMAATYTERLPIVLTRPFNYTGAGQEARFLVPKIVSHFVRGERVIELGNLDVERDFSDVRDVARIYRLLLGADAAGQIVNVCSGRGFALRQVIAAMQEIAGYEIEVRVNQSFVRVSEVKIVVGSPQRLWNLIGEQAAIPLPQTLQWMYSSDKGLH